MQSDCESILFILTIGYIMLCIISSLLYNDNTDDLLDLLLYILVV